MLKLPMFSSWLIPGLFLLSTFVLQAQTDCNCTQQIVVQVNAKCRYVLSKADLGLKNCPDSYILVADNKASNRDTIDAPGNYVYGLYQNNGQLICQGNVIAVSPSGPVLDSVLYVQDTLSFQEVDQVLSQPKTTGRPGSALSLSGNSTRLTNDGRFTNLANDDVPNLGVPYFSMGCQTTSCGITLSFSDELIYSACRDAQQQNLYATIRRSWVARDCQGRIGSSVQLIHFRNPEKSDFTWNIQGLSDRKVTLYYGACGFEFNRQPMWRLYPVTSKQNKAIPNSGLKISQAIVQGLDTVCAGQGIQLSLQYLIYDECREQVIDTFIVVLAPGEVKDEWANAVDTLTIVSQAKNCRIGFPAKVNASLLDFLQIRLAPLCKLKQLDWAMEREARPLSNQWISMQPTRDSLFFHPGFSRITLTGIDSCQNLYSTQFYVLFQDASPFEFKCPSPFEATLQLQNGKKYYYLNAEQTFYNPPPQCRYIEYHFRRLIPANCLPYFTSNPAYDLDKDGNITEHFTFIPSGQFARMYYSPWVKFLEAYDCDEGQRIYFEQRVSAPAESQEQICLSHFDVSSKKPVRAQYEDQVVKVGVPFCAPLKVSGMKNILGLQFLTRYDPTVLRFVSIKSIPDGPNIGNFGYPNPNTRPYTGLMMSWVVPDLRPRTFADQSTLFEVCFTPLRVGESPLWIDTSNYEVIFENGVELAIETQSANIRVVDKNGFQQPIEQLKENAPLNQQGNDRQRGNGIKVFPNPSQDQIQVELPASWTPQGQIVLKDLQGRILMSQVVQTSLSTFKFTDAVPNGVHLLELHTQDQVWTQKIVVLKH